MLDIVLFASSWMAGDVRQGKDGHPPLSFVSECRVFLASMCAFFDNVRCSYLRSEDQTCKAAASGRKEGTVPRHAGRRNSCCMITMDNFIFSERDAPACANLDLMSRASSCVEIKSEHHDRPHPGQHDKCPSSQREEEEEEEEPFLPAEQV